MTAQAPQRRSSWQDVADLKIDLARWYTTPSGQRWLRTGYQANAENMPERSRGLLRAMYATEPDRIMNADPIFVSAEMCEVIEAARGTFEPEPLLPKDLVTPQGFLLYERPFLTSDRFDEPLWIAGFSWQPILGEETTDLVGLSDRQLEASDFLRTLRGVDYNALGDGNGDGILLTVYASTAPEHTQGTREYLERYGSLPAIAPTHFTPWHFGMTYEGNEVDANGAQTAAEWWWKLLQTTYRLMQQTLAVGHRYRPGRSARRGYRKLGMPEDREVVVIRLRRERDSSLVEKPAGSASYTHRFIVHGFWRNQWYPTENTHRQKWIADYVKGDPDLPLIIRGRAFAWTR